MIVHMRTTNPTANAAREAGQQYVIKTNGGYWRNFQDGSIRREPKIICQRLIGTWQIDGVIEEAAE